MKSFANFPHCWLLKKFSHKFMGMRAPRGKLLYDWDMKYTRFGINEEIFVLMLCLWIPSNIPFFNNGLHMSHNLENKFHCSIFLLFSRSWTFLFSFPSLVISYNCFRIFSPSVLMPPSLLQGNVDRTKSHKEHFCLIGERDLLLLPNNA